MRDALAIALDGTVPDSDLQTSSAYRAAAATVSPAIEAHLARLSELANAGLIWASARNDNTHRLLDALGLRAHPTCAIPENDSWPGVIFLGCIPASRGAHGRWIARMLRRGAIVVSSDRSVEAPVIATRLRTDSRSRWRPARISLRPDLTDRMASDSGWGQLLGAFAPAVRLAPGHVPLSREQPLDVDILARDAFTDDPLVVRASVLNGQVVHSVAHWWQNVQPDSTEVGQRSLAETPAFADIGRQFPDALVGGFAAGSVLLSCLLAGVDAALDRHARLIPPASADALVSGD
jgi:hypothetical protein